MESAKREYSVAEQQEMLGKASATAAPVKYRINWLHTLLLTVTPSLALYGYLTTQIQLPTLLVSVVFYLLTGMGITAGYHRLWSHRAYSAKWIVRLILIIFGGAAFEGSCKWWCRNHRAHHRYNDTDKDPYAVKDGFLWAHVGWMVLQQDYKKCGRVDIGDLSKDPMVHWQHKYYGLVAIGFGIFLPTLLCGLFFGDYRGGFFYAAMARIVFVHHATFFVNSLAHTSGERTYSDLHSAEDSWVTALLTLGEGYHNYHHEFPADYRNGIRFYQYDPTKWLIRTLSFFGLTYDLKMYSDEEIEKAKLQMVQRKINIAKAKNDFGSDFQSRLPSVSWDSFVERCKKGERLVVIDGFVHDVTSFVDEHPGGRQTLLNFVGTDSTAYFKGLLGTPQVHEHTPLGWKLLKQMRIAHLKAG